MYSINDKVKFSEFYSEHYLESYGNGIVVEVCPVKMIKRSSISKEDGSFARFKDFYGERDEYPIESFLVKFENCTDLMVVSIFGIDLL